jgi:outer membrane receptor protein involved in Fe transport
MRRFTATRLSFSASTIAVIAAWAAPALAQSETQQQQAQRANTAAECSAITDAAQRQTCLNTQGQNAPASAGAPAEGSIVVTGSRIPRPNFDTVQPAVVLSSEAIEQRGFVDAADALNELPQFGIPGSSPVGGGQGGSFGTGQSFINFLGLGSQRTLVLVNGRRFVSSNTPSLFGPTNGGAIGNEGVGEQVDIGQINTKLINRIETIAVGGAPIYGSDAIAGTVNIILKRDYQGFDLDGDYGISSRGDARNWRVRALAGQNFLDGRANITVSGEYNKGKGFTWHDRKVLSQALFYDTCPATSQFSQCLYPNGPRVNATVPTGAPLVFDLFPLSPDQGGGPAGFDTSVQDANGNDVMFGPTGGLVPINYGLNPPGSIFASGGNGFAYIYDTTQALSDTERYNANLLGHFDITDNIRLFGEGWYSHKKSTNLVAQPEYNSAIFGSLAGEPSGNLILSVNNPFLSAAERTTILNSIANNPNSDQNLFGITQDYFYVSRANTDLTSGRATFEDDLYRLVGGLDGHFNALAGKWDWEAVLNWGRSHTKGKGTAINVQNFNNAVGMVTADNPNGVPCLAGLPNSPYPTLNSTCAPLNLFGLGVASQSAIDYVLSETINLSTNKQFVATADVSGPIFHLPGGDVSIAFGVEHRWEHTNNEPSAFFHGPDPDPTDDADGDGDPANDAISYGQGSPVIPISGSFHTNEVFGELNGDIVSPSNNIAGIYRLGFQSAARYVDHSIAGSDITWTVGSRYAPIRDIAFRGNFTHAIRSPSIQEVFLPTSTFFGFATDPCDAAELVNGPDPTTRQANCAAEGIPANFNSLSDDRSFIQSTGGNQSLTNEKSNAFSVGGVLTPRFIPGFTLSMDYIRVKLRDAIIALNADQVLSSCYDSPDPGANPFCAQVTRDAVSHQLTFVGTSFFNANQFQYRGLVASWDWKMKTPFLGPKSTLDFSGSYQHLFELTSKANTDSAAVNNQGTLGYPKNSWVATLTYVNGRLNLFTNLNYTGRVDQGVEEVEDFREHQRLKSFLVTNAGFRLEINDRFRVFGNVDNLFDVKPPFPVPAFGGSVTYFPGVLGRYVRVGAGVHF